MGLCILATEHKAVPRTVPTGRVRLRVLLGKLTRPAKVAGRVKAQF